MKDAPDADLDNPLAFTEYLERKAEPVKQFKGLQMKSATHKMWGTELK